MLGDAVTFLGMNLVVLMMIVAATELVKEFVTFKNKKFYILVSLGISILFTAMSTSPFVIQEFAFNTVAYFLASKLFYDAILQFIEKKKADLESKQ